MTVQPLAAHPVTGSAASDPSRRSSGPTRGWQAWAIRCVSVLTAIAVWQLLTANHIRFWLRFDTLPTVTQIATTFAHQLATEQYWLDLGQSLIRILTGFALAAVTGVVIGVALGRSAAFANVVGPLTELARPIPAIAIVPVAILLFPSDEAGIVFITFLAAFFPVMVSTRHAVRALPTIWEESVRTLGGSRWDVVLRVVLPGILPGVFGACPSASGWPGSASSRRR